MKINGDASLLPPYLDSDRVSVNSSKRNALVGAESSLGSKVPSAASVSVSSSASSLSKSIESQPNIRLDLVNKLKEEIANGTYKPSPDLIAAAMVNSVFDEISLDSE